MRSESEPTGVTFLDHTADVGLQVTAPTLEELFTRAAEGMACLVHGTGRSPGGTSGAPLERGLELAADDLPELLRAWLRELLLWHEMESLALRSVHFEELTEVRLEARVTLTPDTRVPIREIKGVTLHGLAAERRDDGWTGRVIFDV